MRNMIDRLFGRRNKLIPPKKKIFVGTGNFEKIGEEFFQYFTRLGGLKPGETVLDVGCGIGRMAIPLTKYLNEPGRYEGFDIVADGIKWCREKIYPEYPNFHFQLADVFNERYYPDGKYKASEYKFPYEDNSFDFVFLTSVFTHMLPADLENYFSEIARVLKKDGRSLITFFLLNEESSHLIKMGKSTQNFKYEREGYHTTVKKNPESATAYTEEFIRKLYGKYGLKLTEPIHYGSWCSREHFLSYQDIIIASKK